MALVLPSIILLVDIDKTNISTSSVLLFNKLALKKIKESVADQSRRQAWCWQKRASFSSASEEGTPRDRAVHVRSCGGEEKGLRFAMQHHQQW